MTLTISELVMVAPPLPDILSEPVAPVILLSGIEVFKLADAFEYTGLRLPPELAALSTTLLPTQMAAGVGTETVGDGLTVITTVDVAAAQIPGGSLVVSVSVTVPLVILGVYVDVSDAGFEKVPLGAVQVEVLALPPIVPFNVTDPPAQIVCDEPAFAVVPLLTVTTIVDVAAEQTPAGSLVVSVSVTDPLAIEGL